MMLWLRCTITYLLSRVSSRVNWKITASASCDSYKMLKKWTAVSISSEILKITLKVFWVSLKRLNQMWKNSLKKNKQKSQKIKMKIK